MKVSVGLLFLALSLAFATGYLSLQLSQSDGPAFTFSNKEISEVKRHFRETHPVSAELNVKDMFPEQAGLDLLDPRFVLSANSGRHFRQIAPIYKAVKLCLPEMLHDPDLAKGKLWIAFQCGKRKQLPQDFFDKPPFLFPSGQSYAALAAASNQEPYNSETWIQNHISLFHALELRDIKFKIEDSRRELLGSLSPEDLLSMIAGQSWILAKKQILVRRLIEGNLTYTSRSMPTVDYLVYPRADWDQFLSQYHVQTESDAATGCLFQDDGLCWVKSTQAQTKKVQWSFIALFALAGLLILFCILQIIRSIRTQKLEDDRKKFALQSLTHELRTPLASLVISSENMMKEFEKLNPNMQENFLRIFDDVQRLTRVAETSRNYLGSQQSGGIVSFNFKTIPSVNDFVGAALERYSDEIDLRALPTDTAFTLDAYWVGVCLQNLVQNALQHGKKPVTVEFRVDKADLIISVSDCGSISEKENILKPFYKRPGSPGLGLGLSIIETVVSAMGSELKISSDPTKFELRIVGRS